MVRLLQKEQFKEHRYKFALCHEPDPRDPLAVVRHYNEHAAVDIHLRMQDGTAVLHGSLAKSHLWCAILAFKGGIVP